MVLKNLPFKSGSVYNEFSTTGINSELEAQGLSVVQANHPDCLRCKFRLTCNVPGSLGFSCQNSYKNGGDCASDSSCICQDMCVHHPDDTLHYVPMDEDYLTAFRGDSSRGYGIAISDIQPYIDKINLMNGWIWFYGTGYEPAWWTTREGWEAATSRWLECPNPPTKTFLQDLFYSLYQTTRIVSANGSPEVIDSYYGKNSIATMIGGLNCECPNWSYRSIPEMVGVVNYENWFSFLGEPFKCIELKEKFNLTQLTGDLPGYSGFYFSLLNIPVFRCSNNHIIGWNTQTCPICGEDNDREYLYQSEDDAIGYECPICGYFAEAINDFPLSSNDPADMPDGEVERVCPSCETAFNEADLVLVYQPVNGVLAGTAVKRISPIFDHNSSGTDKTHYEQRRFANADFLPAIKAGGCQCITPTAFTGHDLVDVLDDHSTDRDGSEVYRKFRTTISFDLATTSTVKVPLAGAKEGAVFTQIDSFSPDWGSGTTHTTYKFDDNFGCFSYFEVIEIPEELQEENPGRDYWVQHKVVSIPRGGKHVYAAGDQVDFANEGHKGSVQSDPAIFGRSGNYIQPGDLLLITATDGDTGITKKAITRVTAVTSTASATSPVDASHLARVTPQKRAFYNKTDQITFESITLPSMGTPSVSVTVYRNPVASAPWTDNTGIETHTWSLRKKDGTAYTGFLSYNSYKTFQTGADLTPADLIYLQASLSGVDKSLVHCGHLVVNYPATTMELAMDARQITEIGQVLDRIERHYKAPGGYVDQIPCKLNGENRGAGVSEELVYNANAGWSSVWKNIGALTDFNDSLWTYIVRYEETVDAGYITAYENESCTGAHVKNNPISVRSDTGYSYTRIFGSTNGRYFEFSESCKKKIKQMIEDGAKVNGIWVYGYVPWGAKDYLRLDLTSQQWAEDGVPFLGMYVSYAEGTRSAPEILENCWIPNTFPKYSLISKLASWDPVESEFSLIEQGGQVVGGITPPTSFTAAPQWMFCSLAGMTSTPEDWLTNNYGVFIGLSVPSWGCGPAQVAELIYEEKAWHYKTSAMHEEVSMPGLSIVDFCIDYSW